ncbi:MAG: hypothetical protein JXA66_04670 [Oligoflexia bacterium]|nr:hypothetical protein [Oligoflexia bacterium]
MKKEYDFSNAVKGKFYKPNAEFAIPVYLEKKLAKFFMKAAEQNKTDVSGLVNSILLKEMEIHNSLFGVKGTSVSKK